jgi:hypothetical protein
MKIVESMPTMSATLKSLVSSANFGALHVPPTDLARFLACVVQDQHVEPWLDIRRGRPKAVGLDPK